MLVALAATLLLGSADPLEAGFRNPADAYKPHTWWHWMDGNISETGIVKDLEAMKASGLGGAHIFDVGQGVPAGATDYNTPEWRRLMAVALREAKRLGLDMTMHNSAGWSSSAGPWVQPKDAMKRVVWAMTDIDGPLAGPIPTTVPTYDPRWSAEIGVYALLNPGGSSMDPGLKNNLTGLGPNPGDPANLAWLTAERVIPLGRPDAQGIVRGTLPAGRWRILRMGATLTGSQNVASRPSGLGLEVDKLSAESLQAFFAGGLEPLFADAGNLAGDPLRTVLIDSYETGYNNWTPNLLSEFERRRGYDPSGLLPALAGWRVGDEEQTLGFLFDWRRTLAELWAQNYSGAFADWLQKRGIQLAIEPYGNGNFDTFTLAKPAGLIMGEYWVNEGSINPSVKSAASAAHVYGHAVLGAEALTASPEQAGWRNQPRQWKPFADRGFAHGVNRIIYHRFAHQPFADNVLPGMTMGPWGSHVDRTNTFWDMMPAWNRYLTRTQFMLQQGRFVGDVLLFAGEDAPQSYAGEGASLPAVPAGYDFDYIGLDPLMSLRVDGGRLVLPNGASYAVLVLPATTRMTLPVLRKIASLVNAGARVVGPVKPTHTPSLAESGRDLELIGLADTFWAKVISDLPAALKTVPPDVTLGGGGLGWIHRRTASADVYFVHSMSPYPRRVAASFRISGRQPELWDAETGQVREVPVWRARAGRSDVELPLEAHGSVFVVFRRPAARVPTIASARTLDPTRTAPPPPLTIQRAVYGVLGDPEKSRDVTAILRGAVSEGNLEIPASNGAMGGDPANLIVKSLRVEYTFGGKPGVAVVRENEILRLGNLPSLISPPDFEVAPGRVSLWRPQTVQLTWSNGQRTTIRAKDFAPIAVTGAWNVRFLNGLGAPSATQFDRLQSWTDSQDPGIRYYSGRAVYRKQVNLKSVPATERVVLDLGDVRELCRVRVNGQLAGEFWKPPFRVDVKRFLRRGENVIEVEVTNLWTNRLIGDEQFPDDMGWDGDRLKGWPEWFVQGKTRPEPRRLTFTTWRHVRKDTPLEPSGLMGPVFLRPIRVVPLAVPGGQNRG